MIADPEEQNDNRSQWAMTAVKSFMRTTRLTDADGLDTAVMDLLGDLAHLCDRHGLDLENLLLRAKDHYDAETMDDETASVTGKQFAFLE